MNEYRGITWGTQEEEPYTRFQLFSRCPGKSDDKFLLLPDDIGTCYYVNIGTDLDQIIESNQRLPIVPTSDTAEAITMHESNKKLGLDNKFGYVILKTK